jgi:hypothetical protein
MWPLSRTSISYLSLSIIIEYLWKPNLCGHRCERLVWFVVNVNNKLLSLKTIITTRMSIIGSLVGTWQRVWPSVNIAFKFVHTAYECFAILYDCFEDVLRNSHPNFCAIITGLYT